MRFYTVREIMEQGLVDISESTLRKWLQGGVIPGARKFNSRWKIPMEAINRITAGEIDMKGLFSKEGRNLNE